jgi:hypothetical protein
MKTHVKKYSQGEMLPLETKQSGGKLLPHSDLRRGGSVSRGGVTQQAAGTCEYSNELSGSIKCEEFLD